MSPIWYIFPPEWVKAKNGWHHSCMTPRLPFLPASLLVSRSRFLTTWLCKDFPWLCYCIVGNCHHFELWTRNFKSRKFKINKNSYFLHWNFDWKSCFVVFFLEWNEWKNPQFNFSSQNLSIEHNFFKWDGKETKILHLLFHRIWKNRFFEEPFRNAV